jgi:excisionase family DNA binding protein
MDRQHSTLPTQPTGATQREKPLLSVRQAAALAGLSPSIAYQLAREGRLPGLIVIPGHRLLVRRRVLEEWLAGEDAANTDPAADALRVVGGQAR